MINKVRYLENGYVDVRYLIENTNTFTWCTGGRGTGKTYGACKYLAEEYSNNKDGRMFIYLRRRDTEAESVSTQETNPFTDLTTVKGSKWYKKEPPFKPESTGSKGGSITAFRSTETGEIAGYLLALSTFYKVKSIPFPKVDLIVYDEFIGMKGTRKIKSEYDVFNTMYETVNRNRELNGVKACKLIAFSNSENIGNPIYIGMNIVDNVLLMQKENKEVLHFNDRYLSIVILRDSPISIKKQKTALYMLNKDSNFNRVSLNNDFLYDDRYVKSKNLGGYVPYLNVGELIVYRHKTNGDYYIKAGKNKGIRTYLSTDEDLKRFQTLETRLLHAYINQRVTFETYEAQTIFLIYWDF